MIATFPNASKFVIDSPRHFIFSTLFSVLKCDKIPSLVLDIVLKFIERSIENVLIAFHTTQALVKTLLTEKETGLWYNEQLFHTAQFE